MTTILQVGSVSGALIRRVKKWVKQQSADQLEYFALFYPKESWKKLADLCHLNPEKVGKNNCGLTHRL